MPDKLEIKYPQAHITPFWRMLPLFFRFPWRARPLLFMVCIAAAAALAGLLPGPLGLLLKGLLVYIVLRFGFNVIELFAKGGFEGEAVDFTLWGSETRPAKLGLVVLLFVAAWVIVGESAVASRIASDPRVQQQIIERYKLEHAAKAGQATPPAAARSEGAATPAREGDGSAAGLSRAEILHSHKPGPSDVLWFKLLPPWYWLVMLALSSLLPAATLIIALEGALVRALNPVPVVRLIRTMGAGYVVLWAFFLLVAGARQAVLSVGEHWLPLVRSPVEFALVTCLALVLCAMLGYVLYQYRQDMHLDATVDFDAQRLAGGAEVIARPGSARASTYAIHATDPLDRRVRALVAEGRVNEAIAEVKDLMRQDPFDPDLNTRLHTLYVQQGDTAATLMHGQQWLTALVRDGQERPALAALREMLQVSPNFAVQDSDVLLPTARVAVQDGDTALAASLLHGFDKLYPDHKDLPDVYFLSARLMSERGRQHDNAAQLLRKWLLRYPRHPDVDEVRTYLAALDRLLAQPR